MRVSFTFDYQELIRSRYLYVVQNTNPIYAIKSDPIYQPVRDFFTSYKHGGYPFRLIKLLHATAIKMFEHSINRQRLRKLGWLFATAGLYLALDTKHPNLAIHEHFGDFTAGFSHQFGVGLAALVMSQTFGIPYDQMNRIPVQGRPVLDYEANIPTGGILPLEAKGVTRSDGRGSARKSICKKKVAERQRLQSQTSSIPVTQPAMIGVIVQAARVQTNAASSRRNAKQGLIEIVDPDFGGNEAVLPEENLLTGKYRHYAAVALFAGLYDVAEELLERANTLMTGRVRMHHGRNIRFDERAVWQVGQRNLVGIQWRPSNQAELADDVWFYQAVDRDLIRELIINDVFPNTQPYYDDQPLLSNNEYIESILPDGSYFGMGTTARNGLRTLNPRDMTSQNLHY